MNYFVYFFVIKPLSFLPLVVLHQLSTILFYILYYVIGYRKKVVFQNLQNAFPHHSSKQTKELMSMFFRHLCDIIVESLRMFSISEEEVKRRAKIVNPEIANPFFKKGQSVIFIGGHYTNWELTTVAYPSQLKHKTIAIYTKLKNRFFNQRIKVSRSQYGTELVSVPRSPAFYEKRFGRPVVIGFAIDQASPLHKNKELYWANFLNQETSVDLGPEKYAIKYNLPVFYAHTKKIRRGYYEMELELLVEDPSAREPYEITEKHLRALEKDIVSNPPYWLWSHRRWKHSKKEYLEVRNTK